MEDLYNLIFNKIENLIKTNETCILQDLLHIGNELLNKQNNYLINYPLNICINNYYQNQDTQNNQNNVITKKDVIKIDLGLKKDNEIFRMTKTIDLQNKELMKFINSKLPKKIKKLVSSSLQDKNPFTTDDIRMLIENECLKYDIFPIQNCYSYTLEKTSLDTTKWMILNYFKTYDINDCLIGDPNICFEIEKGDIFEFNIVLIKNNKEFKEEYLPSNFYKFNSNKINLKLQNSRKFYSKYSSIHKDNTFYLDKENLQDTKEKFGINECLDKNLLINIPIIKNKHNENIYVLRFTQAASQVPGLSRWD